MLLQQEALHEIEKPEYRSGITFKFDIRPFTYLTHNDIPSPTLTSNHADGGVQVKGESSGATGYVFGSLISGTGIVLTNVSGTFSTGEKITVSDSAETNQIVENGANTDDYFRSCHTHIL